MFLGLHRQQFVDINKKHLFDASPGELKLGLKIFEVEFVFQIETPRFSWFIGLYRSWHVRCTYTCITDNGALVHTLELTLTIQATV